MHRCPTNQEESLVRSEVENNEDLKEVETHFSPISYYTNRNTCLWSKSNYSI